MLVVLAIIALLASFVAPTVFRNVGDARHTTAQAQIDALAIALHAYHLDVGSYPTTDEGLAVLREPPLTQNTRSAWRGPYLAKELGPDPWRRRYVYVSPGERNPASFDLYSLGRDGQPGGEGEDADVTSWGGEVSR
jgi:general secretion pathway protein G